MVNYYGFLRPASPAQRSSDLHQLMWYRCARNERRGMYHQRHVGQELGQVGR